MFSITTHLLGIPDGSDSKESICNVGVLGLIPGLGRSPGEGNSNPLQYSCLENPMDRGAWKATVHGGHKELDTTERLTYNHLLNVNPNHNEISSHTSQNNYCQKENKRWMLVRMWRKGNPATMGANVNWCSHYANQCEGSSENWN